ncbi:MAG: ArsR family transcriptional regulator [Micavibrio aeruginosavorus]|uniref:ArsR family transcriptional regulator n=1 Tax=Micavibrio aeruginosavorus TaxID=349221 RepID=A0A2W4ZG92_9BACT|nr:MAG: ArsR family transcriptional regulator [Micavibrio aeruginosavorus]
METGYKILEEKTESASALLKALANEKRLLIVCLLCKGEKNVGELEQSVGLSQSALSQHLARLRRDGIVTTRRAAQTIYYQLKDPAVPKLLECLDKIYGDMC